MTIKTIETLEIGTELRLKTGKLLSTVYLATKKRNSYGKIQISMSPTLEQRFWELPAKLSQPDIP